MNEYLKNENSLAPYMVFPRFLLDAGINETAMILYTILLDVKTSLAALEKADLIRRIKQGAGMPSRIYVKIPAERDRKLSVGGTKNCPLLKTMDIKRNIKKKNTGIIPVGRMKAYE